LFGLIATAASVLSVPSLASSIGQRLFAGAAAIVGRSSTPVANANHSSSVEFAAPVESASMASERQGHTATRLGDGRVLIAGGENTSGTLNQTEIYDPASATFSASGNMTTARADHSATLLADGRVLIAGGQNGGASQATTEIFDPATGSFTNGPTMSVARAGHSATLFADGRILIAGGDANGSVEVLDVAAGTSSATGSMSGARTWHSAALLQAGRVLIVGGKDADGNRLSTGEIFDPAAGSFSIIAGLSVGRVQPHLRVLFDGKVQVIGGSNDGSMEVYDPAFGGFGAYAHVLPEGDTCAGLPGQIQSSQTRAALFHNGQSDPTFDRSSHSINELSGSAIVIGGVNTSGTVLSSTPIFNSTDAAISTDKLDYSPGETAYITGHGFQAGETVRLKIHEDPHTPQERGMDVVAGDDGSFVAEYLVMDYDLAMKFIVGARGLTSGRTAQTTFTDSQPGAINLSPSSVTVSPGNSAIYGVTITKTGTTDPCTLTMSLS
jgi:WD40 repeat protein